MRESEACERVNHERELSMRRRATHERELSMKERAKHDSRETQACEKALSTREM